jgi:ABC-2 type transport system permease protein
VIVAAFRSEWIKLRRRTLLLGTFGGLATAASLFVILVFTQAAASGPGSSDLPSLQALAQPNGLIHDLRGAVIFLGVVAFGIAASQIASEYSLGTLRQLLVRQPRRVTFLAGKFLGVVTFLVAAVIFAAGIAGVVAIVVAHLRHVPTAAWFSSTGIGDLTQALGQLLLAVVGFATFGLVVGLFLRSSVFAVIVGFAYLVPVEQVLVRVLPGAAHWLPGQLLTSVGSGGGSGSGFGRALLLSLVYLVVIGAVTARTFVRRDVTA